MKHFIPIMILLAGLTPLTVIGEPLSITENSLSGFSLSYHPGNPTIDTFTIDGLEYTRYSYDSHTASVTPGMPMVPRHVVYFGAPSGSTPRVILSGDDTIAESPIRLIPIPSLGADDSGNTIEIFNEDQTGYAMSGRRPSDVMEIELTVTDGPLAIWRMILSPMQYDAANQTIYRQDGYIISVDFGSAFSSLGMVSRIPSYLLNADVLQDVVTPIRSAKLMSLDANPFSEGVWYKLKLTENGIYKISGAELATAGFPVGSVQSDWLHMFYGGGKPLKVEPSDLTTDTFKRIAFEVNDGGDGTFDLSDSILFYGEALSRFDIDAGSTKPIWQNFLYADIGENVYWLQIQGATSPKYIQTTGEVPSTDITPITTFRDRVHIEPENYIEYVDQYNAESGREWYWGTVNTENKSYTFSTVDPSENPDAELGIGFRNGRYVTDNAVKLYTVNHSIFYILNGDVYNSIPSFSTTTGFTIVKTIPVPNLKPSQNTITMSRTYQGGFDENTHVRLDWFDLAYNRNLKVPEKMLQFFCEGTGSPLKHTISDVNSDIYDIYDTTDPYSVHRIGQTVFDGSARTLTFQTTPDAGEWASFTINRRSSTKKVSSITSKHQVNLRSTQNMADYLLITPEEFSEEAEDLASWRSRDSSVDPLISMKVLIEDIYDEFAWGLADPVAIRDFLQFAVMSYNSGTKPVRYVCLFGDTTYKYKNIDNQEEKNYIPSFTGFLQINGKKQMVFSDDFFTWFDSNRLPELAIGRICATDREKARLIVDKTIAYERDATPGYWRNRLLLVADDEKVARGATNTSNTFTKDIEAIDVGTNDVAYIPETYERVKIFMIEHPMVSMKKPSVTVDLFKQLNDGCLIFNYIGHGNSDVLAHEDVLRGSRDMDKFQNGSRQPIFLAFSCTVGKFDAPGIQSLAESLHLSPSNGSIASIASSRFTYNPENVELNKGFYVNLFSVEQNPGHRIGNALLLSKLSIGESYNSSKYFLFGDPATRLSVPQFEITTTAIDTLDRLERPEIKAVLAPDGVFNGPVSVTVKAIGPRQHKTYFFSNASMNYTTHENVFYNAVLNADVSQLDFSFVVPKDAESDLTRDSEYQRESKIILYAMGPDFESVGVIDNFLIGDIDTDAPTDVSGPSFLFAFDNKPFSSGDVIRRQPELTVTMTDPSGINIVGKRGHNITMLIDGTDPVVLTDHFSFTDGYSTGTITYQLPILDAGEHEFEINAYDTYNNASKAAMLAQVAGSLTGDIVINDLLNYPNPMAGDGTTFTFSLTDYANHASIKVYSQAGRLVDTVSFAADYGFNQVSWHPPVDLANGVYFYKLSVTSSNGRKSSKIEKLVVMK